MRHLKTVGLGLTAALALTLTACGQGSATKEAAAPEGKSVVRYMNFSSNDGHEKDLTAIVNAFQTANPNITVQVETVPYADYFTKLQTSVAGGTAADAFELNYENFVTYAKNGSLAELKNVDTAAYKKSLVDAFNDGGKQYGVPESFSNVVLFYNKALFKKAGVAEPTADWTWKDEQAAGLKLTNKATKTWGDYQPVSYNEFYKVLAQNGGEFLNADRTEATFNSPQGAEAAKFLIDKVGKTMPTEADGAGTPDFDSKLFKSGKLAMWHTGIWMFSAMADAPFDWDVVVEPGNTKKASAMFVNGLVVSAASKNAEAAQKWVTFLASSDDTTKTRLATSWELPPVADEAKLAPYLDQKKPANRKAVFTALEDTVLPPVIERQQEMQDLVTQELTSAAAGRKPVEKALADAQTKVNGLLKK
ncbi:carbohydrate ABC transporter substrate-binding protein (CUT1 family) [Kribbella voronezhensis]|uniref:Carbohydrate ABC transporter substrate-binding protein (CUT1 family) n=1 Tax=Kribbella voronezhensis TaxID=2512212 RepID=A0A4R7T877_9ACTN|nr:sugar ABC transporter substrate-binding protein [Kribbella voronezhensis]TDU88150.1 carbohydrate ABC transporter substrate-binding protein (CUT1 family) [Kribbella voronezhensis]